MFDSQLRRCSGSMWGDILRPRKLKRCRDFQKAKKDVSSLKMERICKASHQAILRGRGWLKDVFMKTWQLRKALDAHLERDSRSDRSCRAKSSFKNVHATHTPTPLRTTCAWLCLVFRPEFVSSYLMNSQLACSHSQEWKAFVTLWWHSWHALSLECPWLQWGRSWTYLVCVSISCDSGALIYVMW